MASTRTAGRVVQVGLAGGTARVSVLKTIKPGVAVSASWWGHIVNVEQISDGLLGSQRLWQHSISQPDSLAAR